MTSLLDLWPIKLLDRLLGRCSMKEFENNWVYPWPDNAYDPVLKVKMRIGGGGRDTSSDKVSIRIDYDPQIEAGRYSQIRVDKRLTGILAKHANDPFPFSSDELRNITENGGNSFTFAAHNEIHGPVRRIKMYRIYVPGNKHRLDPVWTLEHDVKYIKANNFPVISRYPKEFLLYAFKNYIGLSDLNGLGFPPVPNTAVKRIEMCLHEQVMTKFFNLSLKNFEQVEPGWYCISALEYNHESV